MSNRMLLKLIPTVLLVLIGVGSTELVPSANAQTETVPSADLTKASSHEATVDASRSMSVSPEHLPADQLYPAGRLMPLSLFSLPDDDLARARKAGFTMTGPYYGKKPLRHVPAARQHGLKCFYAIGGHRDEIGLPLKGDADPMDADKIKETVQSQMDVVLNDPTVNSQVAIWYLTPEELRPWVKAEMEHLRIVAETAREHDPQKRPVWMYEPNHRTANDLVATGKFLDVIGKGCYVNFGSGNIVHKRPIPHVWVRWSVEQEVEAAATLAESQDGRSPTPIIVLEMSQDPEDEKEFDEIPKWIRHDVYLSLVCGAKGITIWSGAPRKGFEKTRDIFLKAYMDTVREITKEHQLDQVFLFGNRHSDLDVSVFEGPDTLKLEITKGKEIVALDFPSVAHLNVSYKGSRYLMLVNSAEEQVQAKVTGPPDVRLETQHLFDNTQAEVADGSFAVTLEPLGVQVWKFDAKPK